MYLLLNLNKRCFSITLVTLPLKQPASTTNTKWQKNFPSEAPFIVGLCKKANRKFSAKLLFAE